MADVIVQTQHGEELVFKNSDFDAMESGMLAVLGDIVPMSHTVFPPGEWSYVTILPTNSNGSEPDQEPEPDMFDEIGEFMMEGHQYVPGTPVFATPLGASDYLDRVQEEVSETREACRTHDIAGAVDGFLDTAYVAITGAIRFAGVEKARECWEAIMRANTSKIDGTYGETVTDPETGKILKPEGWEAPDIGGILGRY